MCCSVPRACDIAVLQLEPGNTEAVRAARRIKDKVAQAAKENSPIRQVLLQNDTEIYSYIMICVDAAGDYRIRCLQYVKPIAHTP